MPDHLLRSLPLRLPRCYTPVDLILPDSTVTARWLRLLRIYVTTFWSTFVTLISTVGPGFFTHLAYGCYSFTVAPQFTTTPRAFYARCRSGLYVTFPFAVTLPPAVHSSTVTVYRFGCVTARTRILFYVTRLRAAATFSRTLFTLRSILYRSTRFTFTARLRLVSFSTATDAYGSVCVTPFTLVFVTHYDLRLHYTRTYVVTTPRSTPCYRYLVHRSLPAAIVCSRYVYAFTCPLRHAHSSTHRFCVRPLPHIRLPLSYGLHAGYHTHLLRLCRSGSTALPLTPTAYLPLYPLLPTCAAVHLDTPFYAPTAAFLTCAVYRFATSLLVAGIYLRFRLDVAFYAFATAWFCLFAVAFTAAHTSFAPAGFATHLLTLTPPL